jgi:hypothetical protein
VACSAYVAAVLLPGVIARMRRREPRTRLAVIPWGPGALDRFDSGQVDLLLGDFGRLPEGCEARALFADRPVWLLGREYVLAPGAADRRLELEGLAPAPVIRSVWENGFERRIGLEECCGQAGNPVDGIRYRPALDALPYAMIAPLMVKRGDIAALVPRRLALLFAEDLRLDIVEPRRCDDGAEIRIAAIRHPDHGGRAPVAWLLDLVAETAAALQEEENARGRSRTLSPAEDEGPS